MHYMDTMAKRYKDIQNLTGVGRFLLEVLQDSGHTERGGSNSVLKHDMTR